MYYEQILFRQLFLLSAVWSSSSSLFLFAPSIQNLLSISKDKEYTFSYLSCFISLQIFWLMVVTSLILQEWQHYLQDLCLQRCLIDKSQFGGRNKEKHIFPCVLIVEAKLRYWFPNICNGKAIVVAAEVKCMFDSFSTICQPLVKTLGQNHLRGKGLLLCCSMSNNFVFTWWLSCFSKKYHNWLVSYHNFFATCKVNA